MIFLPRGENSKSCRWLIRALNTARPSCSILLASLVTYKSLIILASWPLNKMGAVFEVCCWWSCSIKFCISTFLMTCCSIAVTVWCACLSKLAICHFYFSWHLHASPSPAFLHPLLLLLCLCFTVCPWGNKLPRASAQQAKRESSAAVGRTSCQQKLYAQSVSVVFSVSYSKQSDKGNASSVCAPKQLLWCMWGKRKTEMWNTEVVLLACSVICLSYSVFHIDL